MATLPYLFSIQNDTCALTESNLSWGGVWRRMQTRDPVLFLSGAVSTRMDMFVWVMWYPFLPKVSRYSTNQHLDGGNTQRNVVIHPQKTGKELEFKIDIVVLLWKIQVSKLKHNDLNILLWVMHCLNKMIWICYGIYIPVVDVLNSGRVTLRGCQLMLSFQYNTRAIVMNAVFLCMCTQSQITWRVVIYSIQTMR